MERGQTSDVVRRSNPLVYHYSDSCNRSAAIVRYGEDRERCSALGNKTRLGWRAEQCCENERLRVCIRKTKQAPEIPSTVVNKPQTSLSNTKQIPALRKTE